MSKRAEEAALKAYPPKYATVKRHAKRLQSELVDTHKPVRAIFQHGYEQAEKDLLPIITAARKVYESWMGGTMDDVRQDMVELGKVLNARKEEQK